LFNITFCCRLFRGGGGGGQGRPALMADNLTSICEPIVWKMWEPGPLTLLWAFTALLFHVKTCERIAQWMDWKLLYGLHISEQWEQTDPSMDLHLVMKSVFYGTKYSITEHKLTLLLYLMIQRTIPRSSLVPWSTFLIQKLINAKQSWNFSSFFKNLTVNNHTRKSPSLSLILSQINPFHIPPFIYLLCLFRLMFFPFIQVEAGIF
jgi:hypothetical protein